VRRLHLFRNIVLSSSLFSRTRLLPTLIVGASMLSGCVSSQASPRPGTELTCPNGKKRVVAHCNNVASLKQQVIEGNAGLPKIGLGLSAKFEERAVAQVTEATQQLALELDAHCSKFNACAIEEERWLAEEQRLREHVRLVGTMRTEPSAAVGDAIWENATPALAAQRLSLAVEVEARRPGAPGFAPHTSGAPLHSGDELRFQVQSNLPAYVYVLLLSSQGTPEQLFPSAALGTANPMRANAPVQIPPSSTGVLALDRTVGREHLQIIAAARPISDIETRLATLGRSGGQPVREELLRTVGDLVCEPSGTRGMVLKSTSVSCGPATSRGLVLKPAQPSAGGPVGALSSLLKAEPNDDVIVFQHEIDHVE
jgi:hypothetical protein